MTIYLGYSKTKLSKRFIKFLCRNGYSFENTPRYEIPLMVGLKVDVRRKTITATSGTIMACFCNSYGIPLYITELWDYRKTIFIDGDMKVYQQLFQNKNSPK